MTARLKSGGRDRDDTRPIAAPADPQRSSHFMHPVISNETQAVLLLCGHFGPREASSPLELREFNRLADVIEGCGRTMADLLEGDPLDARDWMVTKLERDRVMRLLGRGAAMALALERWTSAGLWVVARGDEGYPPRLRLHLGRSAPSLLFGVGHAAQIEPGGLAIVGSRDVDASGERFTAEVARQCAREGVPVISGGARGVDEIALAGAFDEGGHVTAVLPEGLGKASVAAKYRQGIREERLVLVSPYAPHAGFTVGNAMGRNRLIYALADAALVVASALRSGGTWAGAEEELARDGGRRVYVRVVPAEGNGGLLKIGGVPFPEQAPSGGIRDLLDAPAPFAPMKIADAGLDEPRAATVAFVEPPAPAPVAEKEAPHTAYDAVLPLILQLLDRPRSIDELATALDVAPAQAKRWIERAIAEKRIVKGGKPVTLRRVDAQQPSLFV